MQHLLITITGLLFLYSSGKCQKQYIFYMNDEMELVSKDKATIIGNGQQSDSVFSVRFMTLSNNSPVLFATFKDSSLQQLHGSYLSYHNNKRKSAYMHYSNGMKHGAAILWDTTGRISDSTVYFEDMPVYKIMYSYAANGDRITTHEFINENVKKAPDEKANVITEDGVPIQYDIWKNTMYGGRSAFKEDKIMPNTYLIYRLSDNFYNQRIEKDPKPAESKFFKTGKPFNINQIDINNNQLKSKDLKGKILVINYWFIDCIPCRMEMPELNKIVEEYKDSSNVTFIGIALDDKYALTKFLKTYPFNYQIVANGREDAHRYGVMAYPTHVIVDQAGKVYFHTTGSPRQTFYWIRKSIRDLLHNPPSEGVPN